MDKRLDIGIGNFGRVVALRLKPGMKVWETVEQVMEEKNMKYATIISGVGAIKEATIRNLIGYAPEFPIGENERLFVTTKGPIELLSLQGSISRTADGKIISHGHAVFCGTQPSGSSFGGHLVEAEVYSNFEMIFVETLDMELLREICPETKALELKPKN